MTKKTGTYHLTSTDKEALLQLATACDATNQRGEHTISALLELLATVPHDDVVAILRPVAWENNGAVLGKYDGYVTRMDDGRFVGSVKGAVVIFTQYPYAKMWVEEKLRGLYNERIAEFVNEGVK